MNLKKFDRKLSSGSLIIKDQFSIEIKEQYEWFKNYCKISNQEIKNKEFWEILSNYFVKKRKQNNQFIPKMVDDYMASDTFLSFAFGQTIRKVAANIFDCRNDQIVISFRFFRLDLPNNFKKDEERLLLPWHQEYSYFKPLKNCSPNSVVLTIPFYDCKKDNGCLIIGKKSHLEGLTRHSKFVIDKKNNKHIRTKCSPPKNIDYLETSFGDGQLIHFMTKHASGTNKSNIARGSLLVRLSCKSDPEFISGVL